MTPAKLPGFLLFGLMKKPFRFSLLKWGETFDIIDCYLGNNAFEGAERRDGL